MLLSRSGPSARAQWSLKKSTRTFADDPARAIRFTTLNAICKVLDCKPGDILDYEPDPEGVEIIEEE